MAIQFYENRLAVVKGDIVALKADAIVNAANPSLLGGGGVDGAIHRRGGPKILSECRHLRKTKYPDGLPVGEAVVTTAGQLPANYVIHTVGPVWQGGGSNEAELLTAAYSNSIQCAATLGLFHIAFPAISTGVFGYPPAQAAEVATLAICNALADTELPRKVTMVLFTEQDYDLFALCARKVLAEEQVK